MTYADIFSRVRRKLNDVNPLYYRRDDNALRMYAGTVMRHMAEIAPQTFAEVRANWARHMQAYAEWVDEIRRGEQERYERRKRKRSEV